MIFKCMRNIFIVLNIIFLASCSTTSMQNHIKVPPNSSAYVLAHTIKKSCFTSADPQFLAEFSAENPHYNFQLEGVWKNNFHTLNMQIIGLLGEQIAFLELHEHTLLSPALPPTALDVDEVKKIISFISSVGAVNLRSLFSGSYAFPEKINTDDYLWSEPCNTLESPRDYFTNSVLETQTAKLNVESVLTFEPLAHSHDTALFIQSMFTYGMFKNAVPFAVKWHGLVGRNNALPRRLEFLNRDQKYVLNVLDYN